MAKIGLYLDRRRKLADGTFPIRLSVYHKRSTSYINLSISVEERQWRQNKNHIRGYDVFQHPNAESINRYLDDKVIAANKIVLDIRMRGRLAEYSNAQLKKAIEKDSPDAATGIVLFVEHLREYQKGFNKRSSIELLELTERKIAEFDDVNRVTFEDIDFAWLTDFDRFMKRQGLATNTRSIYMRNIRAVYNDAIDRDIVGLDKYPFRRFKIATQKTRSRALSVEELRTLRDHQTMPHQEPYRDIFMLMFYLVGINMVDLFELEKIVHGRVEYARAKTGRLYSIKVEPEALEIIERYKGTKHLLDIADRYGNHKNYLARLNRNLKQIGDVVEGKHGSREYTGLFPELSSYWARHTWATIAASLDIPKETIAAALGHGGDSVTDIYISFDQKKIDQANRKVIDYVNEK